MMANNNHGKIIDFASKRFETVTNTEENFLKACVSDTYNNLVARNHEIDNPSNADTWGAERVIHADKLAWLLADPEAKKLIPSKGLKIFSFKIDGRLNLSDIDIDKPLTFYGCYFLNNIYLSRAKVLEISFFNTHVKSIIANNIQVKYSLKLCQAHLTETNEIIEGIPQQNSLEDDLRFQASNIVLLKNAIIGNNLCCDGGHFYGGQKESINAERAIIKGSVFMRYGFQAEKPVNLIAINIKGDIDCRDGHFKNLSEERYALILESINVQGNAWLSNGFKALGGVSLLGSKIGKELLCLKAEFLCINSDDTEAIKASKTTKNALLADNIQVESDVWLSPDFQAKGSVSFDSAVIKNCFNMDSIINPENMELDLSFAKIHILRDSEKSWPNEGKLHLYGLVYDLFNQEAPTEESKVNKTTPIDSKSRLKWIRLQPKNPFSSQSYAQLATVLKSMGSVSDATEVLIAQQRDYREYGKLNEIDKFWNRIFGFSIRYGYRTSRTLIPLLFLWIFGSGIFCYGYSQELITPSRNNHSVTSFLQKPHPNINYPKFNAIIFSLDTLVPLIDLHQQKYWLPNANINKGNANLKKGALIDGVFLRYYFWLHIFLGWGLSSLTVAALTGLIRRI